MKRDMVLVMEILEKVEAIDEEGISIFNVDEFDGKYTETQIEYHVRLCRDAGLVDGPSNMGEAVSGLTWAGHDALARMRNNPPSPESASVFTI